MGVNREHNGRVAIPGEFRLGCNLVGERRLIEAPPDPASGRKQSVRASELLFSEPSRTCRLESSVARSRIGRKSPCLSNRPTAYG